MSQFVIDTHALYWHATQHPRLSPTARGILRAADVGQHGVLVPSIALIELVYLGERKRLDLVVIEQIIQRMEQPRGSYAVTDLTLSIVRSLQAVPRASIPDMLDRIIVATALQLGLP